MKKELDHMKRMHGIGLVAVAALLVTVVYVSAACGFSEWLIAGGGNPAGIQITGTGGATRFESAGKNIIGCEKSESTEEFKGFKEASALVKYKGNCKISGVLNGACTEPIETEVLIALPGTIAGAASGRGLLFLPASGTVMAKPTCVGVKITVEGGIVCESEPVKKLSLNVKVICREKLNAKGEEEPGIQQFTTIEVGGKNETDELIANAIFTKEKDAQVTTETLTYKDRKSVV